MRRQQVHGHALLSNSDQRAHQLPVDLDHERFSTYTLVRPTHSTTSWTSRRLSPCISVSTSRPSQSHWPGDSDARPLRGDRTHVRSLVITVGRALQRRAGTRQTKVVVIKCGRVSLLGIDTSSPSS